MGNNSSFISIKKNFFIKVYLKGILIFRITLYRYIKLTSKNKMYIFIFSFGKLE